MTKYLTGNKRCPTTPTTSEDEAEDPKHQRIQSTPNRAFAAKNARPRRTQPNRHPGSMFELLVFLLLTCAPISYFIFRDIITCPYGQAAKTQSLETAPWPGSTFAILEKRTGRAITVADYHPWLSLEKRNWMNFGDRRMHWVCEEKDGWLGFRNAATGAYIGNDGRGNVYAKAKHHRGWEYWVAVRHPEGGYILLSWLRRGLKKMGVRDVNGYVQFVKNGDTVWEFVKVSAV